MRSRRQKLSIQYNWGTGVLVQPVSVQKGVNSGILTAPTLYWLHRSVCSTFNKWMRAEIDVDVLNRRWADSVPSGAIMWSGGGGGGLSDRLHYKWPRLKTLYNLFLGTASLCLAHWDQFQTSQKPILANDQPTHTQKKSGWLRTSNLHHSQLTSCFFFPCLLQVSHRRPPAQ